MNRLRGRPLCASRVHLLRRSVVILRRSVVILRRSVVRVRRCATTIVRTVDKDGLWATGFVLLIRMPQREAMQRRLSIRDAGRTCSPPHRAEPNPSARHIVQNASHRSEYVDHLVDRGLVSHVGGT